MGIFHSIGVLAGALPVPAGTALGAGGLGISGAVSADGDLATLGPITTNGNGSTRGIYVAVKQGSGVVAATFNGIYTMVSLSTTSSVTATDGRVYTVDVADGSFGGAYDENDAGTASTNHLVAGTYTLAADGTLQWAFKGGASMTGTLSADGNVFVLTDLTSGEAPTLLVGVRQ